MNKKYPQIRIKNYSREWESQKFLNIVIRVNTKSDSKELPKIEFEDIVAGEGRLNKDVTEKFDNRKGTKFEPSNILYGKLRPYLKNWLYPNFTGVALGDFWVLEAKNTAPIFIYYLIQSSKYQKVANDTSGTKMPRSDWNKVSNTKFNIPSLDEQKKIGSFFEQLDKNISLQKHELTLLKQRKKAFLQKMFPKKGDSVPELLLSNHSKDWVVKTIGHCFDERNERSSEGELLSVTIKSGVVKASSLDRKDNSSNNKSNYKVVKKGDIAYNSMRMWQGASGLSLHNGIVSPAYTILIPNEEIDSNFFSYYFKLNYMIQTFQSNSQGLTSDTWNLKYPIIKTIKIAVPPYIEQQKIGNFFKHLDDDIALHEQKLEKLKEMKKAFLQKMFV